MWWRSFRGGVAIMKATSLAHARLSAVHDEFSRAPLKYGPPDARPSATAAESGPYYLGPPAAVDEPNYHLHRCRAGHHPADLCRWYRLPSDRQSPISPPASTCKFPVVARG